MTFENQCFMQAVAAALAGKQVCWSRSLTDAQWQTLFDRAAEQRVLPLVYEAVRNQPMAPELLAMARRETVRAVMVQTNKTAEFLQLYALLRDRGLTPLVVKGLVCRSLYPMPDHRISADEDLLVPQGQLAACMDALEAFGMQTPDPEAESFELPYRKEGSPLYIELHKALFQPDSAACGDLNSLFADVFSRAVPMRFGGTEILTLRPTDHLLYLICHAFKHFLYSGFGIRQVCDILLFARSCGQEIHWAQVQAGCRAVRAEGFADALFQLGREHLDIQTDWPGAPMDCGPMLADILEAGVYGSSTLSRKHSARVTLNATAAHQRGKTDTGLLQSMFPPAASLKKRYPWLQSKPWLLPAAWAHRLFRYHRETRHSPDSNAADAIRIGNQRLALLRYYGILSE